MITFILGEDRHVKYFVHSVDQYDYFAIKEANFSLLHNGKEEAAGVCTIERDEEKNGYYVDTKIQPMQKSRMYTLEIELKIADEIIKKQGDDGGNLMIRIEKIELSPNPVSVNGKVKISVTIVTHEYLNKNYTHKKLATYTHKQLKDRGTT